MTAPASEPPAGLLSELPVLWHPDSWLHEPTGEVWLGIWEPGTEVPQRASVLLDALTAAGAEVSSPAHDGESAILAVHDAALVEHLATAWEEWEAGGYTTTHARPRVVPYLFPTPGLLQGLPMRSPRALHGRIGRFCYDTMTLIGPGTWRAAKAAAGAAAGAAEVVAGGAPLAYALSRPPGHHAGPDAYGGSCYLNNAAISAQALRDSGASRVAVLDIDAHHANGTQAIFYRRDDVYVGSVHVDPGAGWFPHYVGFASERGQGAGQGANRNLPLAPGSGDHAWLTAVDVLCEDVRRRGADAIVVSLGLDAAASDPESPLQVSAQAYHEAGRRLGRLGPTVVVQEGGYDLEALGHLAVSALAGARAGRRGEN
jgi:acetoin utilization deacetylase AcuC-like enzyme